MRFLTSGESHGEALTAIISEFPAGISVDTGFIDAELARRQSGFGRGARMKIEKDRVRILSGINKGKTTGSPITIIIKNIDWENSKEKLLEEKELLNPRPGHADLPGLLKYRLESIRNVIERSSARETAARVAVGAFAKIFLMSFDIITRGFVEQLGEISIDCKTYDFLAIRYACSGKRKDCDEFYAKIEKSPVRCPDKSAEKNMMQLIEKASAGGDTLGGRIRIITEGMIAGLGSFIQWDQRLDAKIAAAIMSIPSVKSVGFGKAFNSSELTGLKFHDEIFYSSKKGFYRKTNNAGGFEGGMTNGENLDVRVTVKPIPTTSAGLKTVDIKTKKSQVSLKERSDICAVPSVSVIAESLISIEIMNAFQDKFGEDSIQEIKENYNNYKKYISHL
ncbi:MAG: chorismate synthase [Actinobacteria bacterium]|nr:chorismate synthase [Actinomycetota bacterium]